MKRRRFAIISTVAAVLLAVLAWPAVAGHLTSGVKSVTGCLVTATGQIVKVQVGNSPLTACESGEVKVHLSGGDITQVTAGAGLSGGSLNGAAGLGIATGGVTSAHIADGTIRNADIPIRLVQGTAVAIAHGATGAAFASCNADEVSVGGGARWDAVGPGTHLLMSGPSFRADGTVGAWRADGQNTSGSARQFVSYAYCIRM